MRRDLVTDGALGEREADGTPVVSPSGPQTLREVEARHIAGVLTLTRGRIGQAAKILGLHRNTLTRKIRQYGL